MIQYIQLVRRHEITAKGADGKKLDRPTPEGFLEAYKRGIKLREMYPGHKITAASSPKNRTQIAATAWLLGAGIVPADVEIEDALGVIQVTPEEAVRSRNAPSREIQARLLYDDFREATTHAGLNMAQYLLTKAQNHPQTPTVGLRLTHGPPEDAAYLLMTGKDVSYDAVMANGGMFPEGIGFDFEITKDGSLYIAEITANDNVHKVEVGELEARLHT